MRDRIKALKWVRAGDLHPDARNWRRHPDGQREALQAMMDEIGVVDAVIARDTPDGLVIVDGHLRADLDPDAKLPVLVTDLTEEEAGVALATLDPLSAMAETDADALDALIGSVPDCQPLLDQLATHAAMAQTWIDSDLAAPDDTPHESDGTVLVRIRCSLTEEDAVRAAVTTAIVPFTSAHVVVPTIAGTRPETK